MRSAIATETEAELVYVSVMHDILHEGLHSRNAADTVTNQTNILPLVLYKIHEACTQMGVNNIIVAKTVERVTSTIAQPHIIIPCQY